MILHKLYYFNIIFNILLNIIKYFDIIFFFSFLTLIYNNNIYIIINRFIKSKDYTLII